MPAEIRDDNVVTKINLHIDGQIPQIHTIQGLFHTVKTIVIKSITLLSQRQLIPIHISVVPKKGLFPHHPPPGTSSFLCPPLQPTAVKKCQTTLWNKLNFGTKVAHAAEFKILLSFSSLTTPVLTVATWSKKHLCHQLQTLILCQAKYHSQVCCATQHCPSRGLGTLIWDKYFNVCGLTASTKLALLTVCLIIHSSGSTFCHLPKVYNAVMHTLTNTLFSFCFRLLNDNGM